VSGRPGRQPAALRLAAQSARVLAADQSGLPHFNGCERLLR
jgi:hypothetical protein